MSGPLDLVLSGGRVLTPEGRLADLDIGVRAGRIERLAPRLDGECERVDAGGLLVLPGLVDDHVHYREPGAEAKEDFRSGSLASAHGGATAVAEIQNNAPLVTTRERLLRKLEIARAKSVVDVRLYANANASTVARLGELADLACGFKIFLAPSHGDQGVVGDEELLVLFEEIARLGQLAVVHAEDRALVERGQRLHGNEGAAGWSRARSARAEALACERAIRACRRTGCRLHLFHLSSAAAVDLVEEAKEEGLPVTAATCPHYLLFTERDVERLGGLLKCNPSIKSETDRARLREALASGVLDVVETDHAPHTVEEKSLPFERNPAGISSADVFLPALWWLVEEGVLDVATLVERASSAPARLLGLEGKGRIEAGADADFVLVDPSRRYRPRESDFLSKARRSPYVGMEFPATVVGTLVRGRFAYRRGDA